MPVPLPRRVTQRVLAQLAAVSHTTVSLALRGHASIPEVTRTRIQSLAKKHGYRPDPMLSALNAYRVEMTPAHFHGTIAWITAFPEASSWRRMIQAEGYFDGARARAAELGYELAEFWATEPGLSASRLTDILLARGIQGLIIAPLPQAQGALALQWEHFAAVALGYTLARPQIHMVMNHQFRNMKRLVQRLHDEGHQRIGFAMPVANDERVDHNYLGGYWVAQHDLPATIERLPPLLAQTLDAPTFLTWFRRQRPDVVIVAARQAYEVIGWLKNSGIRVPADVGVAVAAIPYRDTTIGGIDENVRGVGAMTVDTLVGMLHRSERGIPATPWRILADGTWSPGKTILTHKRSGGPRRTNPHSTRRS
ncbi:MAG: LacI family DNA-binding transcriptional regulator [Opitutaceae bacterium]